ncbi:MAG: DUF3606 domain-containing protein [Achromobacter sp.]
MTHLPKPTRPHDRPTISLLEPQETREWCQYFGTSEAELRLAIRAVGVQQVDVRAYLRAPPTVLPH